MGRRYHQRSDLGVLSLSRVRARRRLVGWVMGNDLRAQIVLDAMNMAIGQRKPVNVIHYSDQGSQYTSIAFRARCTEAGALSVDEICRRLLVLLRAPRISIGFEGEQLDRALSSIITGVGFLGAGVIF